MKRIKLRCDIRKQGATTIFDNNELESQNVKEYLELAWILHSLLKIILTKFVRKLVKM